MRRQIVLSAVLASLLALPVTAHAQNDPTSDTREILERGLLERLCAVDMADEVALAACIVASARTTTADVDVPAIVEESVRAAQARVAEIDLRAALDEVIAAAQDVDLDAAIDAAIAAASEVDVEAAVADAVSRARDLDLQAALDAAVARVDETVGAVGDVDVAAWLEEGIGTTRGVVAEAQQWVQENAEVVCAGSGLSAGAAAAAVVAYVTGSPGLAIRAFEETERLGSDVCTRVAAPSAGEASPDQG